jgi:hypothetical protein
MKKWNVHIVVLLICAAFGLYFWSRPAGAQEEVVPVPKAQIVQILAEHHAALEMIDALQREVARLRAKLACV